MAERGRGEIEALRQAIIAAHERFDAAVADLDPAVLETVPAVGAWSPRDVAGHVADWEQEMLDAAEHILGGPAPRGQPIRDEQSYNTLRAALRGADPWERSAADLAAARERALAFLDRLSPSDLDAIGPFPWGEVGRLRRLLAALAEHVDEHAAQLAAWRERRATGPGERAPRRRRER